MMQWKGRVRTAFSAQWLGYGLDDSGFKPQQEQQIFFLLKNFQTGSGAQTATCALDIGGCFPRVKASRACGWPLTLISH
jgi:hypothetical protein